MKRTIEVELKPWNVPNYVCRETGETGIALLHLSAETLSDMCDDFRKEVFRKAKKVDPKLKGKK